MHWDLGVGYDVAVALRFRGKTYDVDAQGPYRSLFVRPKFPSFECRHTIEEIEAIFVGAEACLRDRADVDFEAFYRAWDAFRQRPPDTPLCDVVFALSNLVYQEAAGWARDGSVPSILSIALDQGIETGSIEAVWSMARALEIPIFGVARDRVEAAYGLYQRAKDHPKDSRMYYEDIAAARQILETNDDDEASRATSERG